MALTDISLSSAEPGVVGTHLPSIPKGKRNTNTNTKSDVSSMRAEISKKIEDVNKRIKQLDKSQKITPELLNSVVGL
jgi:hypothetical protein